MVVHVLLTGDVMDNKTYFTVIMWTQQPCNNCQCADTAPLGIVQNTLPFKAPEAMAFTTREQETHVLMELDKMD